MRRPQQHVTTNLALGPSNKAPQINQEQLS